MGVALLLLALFSGSCKKYEVVGKVDEPGVAFTFDDSYVDEWYKHLNLLDSFNIHATFYISNYHTFNAEQKQKLRVLESHGNEIAYHSSHHVDFAKYGQGNTGKLMKEEIENGMALMAADGFHCTDFAYPFGSHTTLLDKCLLRTFKSIRMLNGTPDISKSYTTGTDNSMLYAMGMDLSAGKSTASLLHMLRTAKDNRNCLVLVGHHIDDHTTNLRTPLERLRKLFALTKELGLKSYTVREISRQ